MNPDDVEFNFYCDYDELLFDGNSTQKLKSYALALVASKVEKKIVHANSRRTPIKCLQCLDIFIQNELIEDDFVRAMAKNFENLQPCKSTFHICKFIDKFMDYYGNATMSYQRSVNGILQSLDFDLLYPYSDFNLHSEKSRTDNHKYDVVKCVVETYLDMKSRNTAKTITLQNHTEFIRSDYTQKIHLAGQ